MNEKSQLTEVKKLPSKDAKFAAFLYSNRGKRLQPVYERVFDKERGEEVVKKVMEIDIYEVIQSSAGACDLAQLRAQYIKTGVLPNVDPSLQHGVPSIQANNIHEFMGLVNGARDSFEKLDPKIQAIFGDADSYVKSLLRGDANSILLTGLQKQEVPTDTPENAVKGEE